jgi:hypothetical protein
MVLEAQPVVLRGYPADRSVAVISEEELDVGMLEIGVLLGIEVLAALEIERGYPVRIIGEDEVRGRGEKPSCLQPSGLR